MVCGIKAVEEAIVLKMERKEFLNFSKDSSSCRVEWDPYTQSIHDPYTRYRQRLMTTASRPLSLLCIHVVNDRVCGSVA